jgi:hypothetical protein
VTADEAVAVAFLPGAPNITSAQAVLVVFTGGMTDVSTGEPQYQHVLAWDEVEAGCCPKPPISPLPGTDVSAVPCAGSEHSIVDATSGRLLLIVDV